MKIDDNIAEAATHVKLAMASLILGKRKTIDVFVVKRGCPDRVLKGHLFLEEISREEFDAESHEPGFVQTETH